MSNIRNRIEQERLETVITDEFIEKLSVLVLVQGVLEDGQPHWAYASIPHDKYRAFKTAEATGTYDLHQFGTVAEHGNGLIPPENIRLEIEARYGASHRFEDELRHMADAMQEDMFHDETETNTPPDE